MSEKELALFANSILGLTSKFFVIKDMVGEDYKGKRMNSDALINSIQSHNFSEIYRLTSQESDKIYHNEDLVIYQKNE